MDTVTRAADVTMVPSSSAQREPSMEEILASIRRIIEDNDAGRSQPVEADAGEGDEEDADLNVIEVNAFRSELRAPAAERPKPSSEASSASALPAIEERVSPVANDDQGRKAPPVAEALRNQEGERPSASARIEAEERIRMAINNARMRSEEMKRDEDAARLAAIASVPPQASVEPEPAPEAEQESVAEPVRQPVIEREASPLPASTAAASVKSGALETLAPKPAILSEQAERKIAASFGELSEAFAARSQKTFDDMAQEMLQPMLREWLDNNLPVLVERLVREEIERVARGSQ